MCRRCSTALAPQELTLIYSLKNPDVQRRFRDHIDAKLVKFDAEGADASSVKRKEELGIILLDLSTSIDGF